MILDKARELIGVQVGFGRGYNRNVTRLILPEAAREHKHKHEQTGVDVMIRKYGLDSLWGIEVGSDFSGMSKLG